MSDSVPQNAKGWRIGERIAWTESDDRAVVLVLDRDHATPIALEGSALVVWRLIAEHGPIADEELVSMTAAEFSASSDLVRGGVCDLLSDLGTRGALQRIASPSDAEGSRQ